MDGQAGTSARAPDAAVLCALAVSVAVHATALLLPLGPLRAPDPARPPLPLAVRIAPPPEVKPPTPLPVAVPRPPASRSGPAASPAKASESPVPPRTPAPPSPPPSPSPPANAAPAAAAVASVVAPAPAAAEPRTATPVVAAGAAATAASDAPSAATGALTRPGPPAASSPPGFDADYLHNPPPRYPPAAQRLRESGRVLLSVQVSAAGLPERVELAASSGSPRLDQAALDTVRRWRFVPARQGGQAVAAGVVVPIVFRLEDEPRGP